MSLNKFKETRKISLVIYIYDLQLTELERQQLLTLVEANEEALRVAVRKGEIPPSEAKALQMVIDHFLSRLRKAKLEIDAEALEKL